jgi:YVTN family beta-propeller protein
MQPPILARAPGRALTLAAAVLALVGAACTDGGDSHIQPADDSTSTTAPPAPAETSTTTAVPKQANVYEFTQADDLAPSVRDITPRVYVPNSESGTVSVIDPATFQVVDEYPVGRLPQHVVPSHDMQTLYVNNNQGNSLTPIDPRTGRPGPEIPVDDPYNLYFTPDGTKAVVIAERNSQIDFRDPRTWELIKRLDVPTEYRNASGNSGVNHAEFTADGKTMVASCEFSGWLVRVDLEAMEFTGALEVGGKPVDLKLSPDGSLMYNANETENGVSVVDWANLQEVGFIPTGAGTHGLYPSRDGKLLYASNRLGGSVTVIDFATQQIIDEWAIPGGGSPDMGGVSTDGGQLWLSGRYNSEVYVFDTSSGEVIQRINVGSGPHGLAVFPQPGRYSMGHTGNYR